MIPRTRPRTGADRAERSRRKDTKHGGAKDGHKVRTTIIRPQPILAFYHLVFFHFFFANSKEVSCKGRPGFFFLVWLFICYTGPWSSHVIGHNVYLEVIRGAICSCPEKIFWKLTKKNEGTCNGDKIPKRNPLRCQANKMPKSKSVPSNASNYISRWVSVYVCVCVYVLVVN